MQFLIIGLDGTDSYAPARRAAARKYHIAMGEKLRTAGNLWYGAAILNPDGSMSGSMYLVDFPDLEDVKKWLAKEPYVTRKVWKSVQISPASVRDPWQFSRPRKFFKSRKRG